MAIALAVLVFIIERTVRRYRARDGAYERSLGLVIIASGATALLAGLSWSAWMTVAPDGVDLLLGWDSRKWLASIFALGVGAAVASMGTAAVALIRFKKAGRGSSSWEP
jgi:hypothetical protein